MGNSRNHCLLFTIKLKHNAATLRQATLRQAQDDIQKALQWTEQEYFNFQFETGIAYLEHYIPGDAHGIDMLSRDRIYWNWWKNHWAQRDEQFMSLYTEEFSHPKILAKVYHGFHNVYTLLNEIYPGAAILSDSYAVMIDDFHNATLRQAQDDNRQAQDDNIRQAQEDIKTKA